MFRTLLLSSFLLAGVTATAQTPVLLAQDAEHLVINDQGDIAYIADLTLWSEKGFSFQPRTRIVTQLGFAGIPSFPLAQITEFGPFAIDLDGDVFGAFDLQDNLNPSLSAGFFRGTDLALINGDPSVFPPLGLGSVWFSFDAFVKVNGDGRVLLAGQVQDPAIPGFADEVLLSMDFDATGLPSAVQVHGYEGAVLPDQASPILFLPDSPVEAEINGNGDVLWGVRFSSGGGSAIYLNDQLVLQEGDPTSIPGLNIGSLTSAPLDLNDAGDWLVFATLTPSPSNTSAALIKNGLVILREGDPLGSTGFTVEELHAFAPVALTDAGESLCLATLSPTIGSGTGPNAIVLDDEILAQVGTTRVQGQLLESLHQGQQSPSPSPNGRYVTYRGTLELGADVIVLLDLGRTEPLLGCSPNEGTLSRDRGFPVVGGTMDLRLDNAQSLLAGANPYLLFSSSPAPGFPPCGMTTPWGELLINFGSNGDPFFVQQATSNPQSLFFSQSPALVNQTFYVQGIFFDPGASPPFRYTNALEVEIGA